ncbi:unnamed protein product [Bursaphelenchus okinawaensis]|uniref:Peptidase A1 domain-containing protein n=1 Tax=Bursaphelenchus okinawaensis TaxID=465554 RepID=A0A811K9Q9_9BILA|nr:unnamed protein product [Bursaphelenchus okinawaensis]CAG9098217.1 unnamed protein product [Bursaphelenchus okinawaensis]
MLPCSCNPPPNYYVHLKFPDHNEYRHFYIDISQPETFVLDATKYSNLPSDSTFEPRDSRTFQDLNTNFTQTYITYSTNGTTFETEVSGDLGKDTVIFNKIAKLNTTFAVVSSSTGRYFPADGPHGTVAGRFGLANKKGKTSAGVDVLSTYDKKVLCFGAKDTTGQRAYSSVTYFGSYPKVDPFIVNVPTTKNCDGTWQVPLPYFSLEKFKSYKPYKAVFDSVSKDIVLPEALFNRVIRTFSAKYDREQDTYWVLCYQPQDIEVEINGKKLKVPFTAYTETGKDDKCYLNLKSNKSSDKIIFGTSFYVNKVMCLNFDANVLSFYEKKT